MMTKKSKETGVRVKDPVQEFRKGSTDIIVLKMLNEQPMYGYQLSTELSKRSGGYFEFKQGTLYPALHRLEEKKWIEGRWADENELEGPRRKYYYITDDGCKALKILTEEWRIFSDKLGSLL